MKKKIAKLIRYFKKDNMTVFAIKLVLLALIVLVAAYLAIEVWGEVLITFFGVLLSSVAIYGLKAMVGRFEDALKINFDTKSLLGIYKGAPAYKRTLRLNGTEKVFAYDAVLTDGSGTFEVKDDPKKEFQLDPFILANYNQIFAAHSGSAKANFFTIRMDDYDAENKVFYLSRSTYFNHLVTNRAVDFQLFEDISLRDVYEYGPRLTPLSESKMSNHVGINGLVFLKGGYLLIPRRKLDSTISKNMVTSSIAVMLNFPKAHKNNPRPVTITPDYLFRGNVVQNLTDRVKINTDKLEKENKIDVRFLGFGRNVYEGGKPQMYYAVYLDMTVKEFWANRYQCIEQRKAEGHPDYLDVDKCIYVAKWDSMKLRKDFMTFDTVREDGADGRRVKVGYERSYLCNLWHYQESGLTFHTHS